MKGTSTKIRLASTTFMLAFLAIVAIGFLGGTTAAAPVTSCGEINQSGVHTVQNFTVNGTGYGCVSITADDVELDLNGAEIDANESYTSGVYVDSDNVTVRNGTLLNFTTYGIDPSGYHTGLRVESVHLGGNSYGFHSWHPNDLTLDSVSIEENEMGGIFIRNSSSTTIVNSSLQWNADTDGTDSAVDIAQSSNIHIENTTIHQTGVYDPFTGIFTVPGYRGRA
ncbi:MAG: right-handed parallel beta-helix repeat-containing protein [Natrialbaceae archaeon]|nr:right-handed parallel beta-helix repeat-containing protein [Natrialbaceae archaeon]